jgi:hypothetical protein
MRFLYEKLRYKNAVFQESRNAWGGERGSIYLFMVRKRYKVINENISIL